MTTAIRSAIPEDVPSNVELIRGLADFEGDLDTCQADPAALEEHLFGPHPCIEVLMAEQDGQPAGFALYF